jgi:hypothetical protein
MNRRQFLLSVGAAGTTLAFAPNLLASTPEILSVALLANAFGEISKDNLSVANVWLHPEDAPAYKRIAARDRDFTMDYGERRSWQFPKPAVENEPEFLGFLWGAHVWTLPGLKERGTVWVHSDYTKGRVKLVGHRTDRTGTGLVCFAIALYPEASRATDAANDTYVMSTMRDSILMADQRVWASFWKPRNSVSVLWHEQDIAIVEPIRVNGVDIA